ncbi:MAG: S8 family serine peptidase, partial [Gammaproteobacteria bacterium]|nr:S8 family serine peptidase [Gammaproteobacteria bacterium]
EILARDDVMLCHPELVRRASQKQTAKPQQWHLRRTRINGVSINEHANVQSAWSLSEGEGMTIAIIDDGVDVNHEEFQTGGKIVAPRDVTQRSNNAAPGPEDMHGTACAGVACANGAHGATGVAPRARLMPIRLTSGLGSQAEADAFEWAATHGADVISCSWGPPDGEWWNDDDPQHEVVAPLPDSTRLAIDYAVNHGRNGKGCVITWAAGNGNESVTNDHYASYDKVIAVGACNDEGKRSAYSDIGSSLWCCFPSGDPDSTRTPGIWTTDNSGLFGYNDGNTDEGDAAGNYTNSFSGTSSSCPGVAGVCALVLARNPDLTWDQVRDILRQSADHIDARRGEYDADGHSLNYGYGRLNALHAVELASPATTNRRSVLHRTNRNVRIRDRRTARLGVRVSDTESLKDIMIHVDIEHTWIGDLRVRLRSPSSLRVRPIVLHNRTGREKDNIRRSYTVADIPALAAFIGQPATGRWRLEVYDAQRGDKGRIVSFGIEIIL